MAGRSLIRWLAIGFLSLAVIAEAVFLLREYLVDVAATAIAQHSNVPVRSFEVTRVHAGGLTIENIALGDANGPTARSVEISWTSKSLSAGRVENVVVREPRISMTYSEDRFSVDGLAMATAGGAGPAPFARLDIVSAAIAVTTPWGPAEAHGDARIVSGPEGFAPARIDLKDGKLDFAGGTLSLTGIAFDPTKPLDANLKVDGVDLQALLALIDVDGLNGSGSISGAIPVHLDNTGVSIAGGALIAAGPGLLSYLGDALPRDIPNLDQSTGDAVGAGPRFPGGLPLHLAEVRARPRRLGRRPSHGANRRRQPARSRQSSIHPEHRIGGEFRHIGRNTARRLCDGGAIVARCIGTLGMLACLGRS